jgi:hypothetical protein
VMCISRVSLAAGAQNSAAFEQQAMQQYLKALRGAMAWYAGIFGVATFDALVTLAGLALVWFALKATQRAAVAAEDTLKETRRIGEAEVRAYLSAERAQFIYGSSAVPMGISARADIRNSGRSPATNARAMAFLGAYVPPDTRSEGGFVSLLHSIPAGHVQSAIFFWPKDSTPHSESSFSRMAFLLPSPGNCDGQICSAARMSRDLSFPKGVGRHLHRGRATHLQDH